MVGASGSQRKADINQLKAHIRPNKQTRATNSNQQPLAQGVGFKSIHGSPHLDVDRKLAGPRNTGPEAARKASVESSLERRYFSSEQAFEIYSNQFKSTRVAAEHTKYHSLQIYERTYGKEPTSGQSPSHVGTPSSRLTGLLPLGREGNGSYRALHKTPHPPN